MTGRTLLTDALVVTCTGAKAFEGSVLVEGDSIVEVAEGRLPPGDATVVRCSGRTLLPGLIDAHVHIGAIDVDIQQQHRRYLPSELALAMGKALVELRESGFTTVRDAGGADAGFRRACETGLVPGPRLRVSGRPLTQTGGHGDLRQPPEGEGTSWSSPGTGLRSVVADGVDEVRRAAREQLRRGADQIKVMAGGGVMSPADKLGSDQYSAGELAAAVEEAAAAGTYVMAHAYTPSAVRRCVDAGARSIEHGNLIDESTARLLAERKVFLVPTLVAYEALHEQGKRHGVPKENLEKLSVVYDAGLESLKVAKAAGVRIGSGSDLLGPLRRRAGREVAIKAKVLGAMDALIATTRTNAELMGLDHLIGTVEAGKLADLLVVDGSPLESPEVLGRPERVHVLMVAGKLVRQPA
ncbi:MAG: amidohydrolase family protein [Acidimicrobiales bacterium]